MYDFYVVLENISPLELVTCLVFTMLHFVRSEIPKYMFSKFLNVKDVFRIVSGDETTTAYTGCSGRKSQVGNSMQGLCHQM